MTEPALDGADVTASGHPIECTEPAPGTVESDQTGITVTVDGSSYTVSSTDASIDIPSHAHDYTEEDGCIDTQAHTISPNSGAAITIDGSPMLLEEGGVGTDPVTGGSVDITNNPQNTEIDI